VSAHDHTSYVEGCFRCDLSRDEVQVARASAVDRFLEVATEAALARSIRLDDHTFADEYPILGGMFVGEHTRAVVVAPELLTAILNVIVTAGTWMNVVTCGPDYGDGARSCHECPAHDNASTAVMDALDVFETLAGLMPPTPLSTEGTGT
jgi:hypothetical protein